MAENEQKANQLCAEAEKKLNAKPFLGKNIIINNYKKQSMFVCLSIYVFVNNHN